MLIISFSKDDGAMLIRTSLLAILASLLGMLLSSAVAAQTLPNQCRLIENRSDGVVIAECLSAQGERASAIRPTECRASLSNRDGVLACTGSTALMGPLRTVTAEGRIGDLLANVLGAPRLNTATDTSWADNFRPSEERRTMPETRIAKALSARQITAAEATALRRTHRKSPATRIGPASPAAAQTLTTGYLPRLMRA